MAEPLEHICRGVRYTCYGNGLLKDGHLYDAHVEKFIPPRNGAASQVEKKLVAWWKAQCAFRGLNQTGAINDLQVRLRDAKATMLPELKAVQTDLNREYKKRNKTQETWTTLKTVEQKAKADPERFLTEAFPRGATGRPAHMDFVVVKLQDHPALADAAEKLGLERVSVDAPWTSGKKPSPDRWLIIGRHRDTVWNQMQEIQRETLRSKQTYSVEAQLPTPAPKKPRAKRSVAAGNQLSREGRPSSSTMQAQNPIPPSRKVSTAKRSVSAGIQLGRESRPYSSAPQAEPPFTSKMIDITQPAPKGRTKQTAKRSNPTSFPRSGATFTNEPKVAKGVWDFAGLYKISCPELEGQWPQKTELSLNLLFGEGGRGKTEMIAEFDFGIITGFMRFERPTPIPKFEHPSSKRKREQDLDEEGDMKMYNYPLYNPNSTSHTRDDSSYNPTVFNFTSKDMPTVRRPIWRYRWRGRETSENQIQLGSDRVVETITFEKGGKLSGMFSCGFAERCLFTGVKMKTSKLVNEDGPEDIEKAWGALGEGTHGYEEKARWGGSGGYGGWR